MIITIIPPLSIPNHLRRVSELMDRVSHLLWPRAKPSDIIADCINSDLVMWGVFDEGLFDGYEDALLGILVVYRRDYWRCKVLEEIVLSGYRMDEWLDELYEITDKYAEEIGCTIREIPGGRKGWLRRLSNYGYKASDLVHLECPVGQKRRQHQ